MNFRQSAASLLLAGLVLLTSTAQATVVVRVATVLGDFDVWLRDDIAWSNDTNVGQVDTMTNFMNYVNSGAYDNSFIHRVLWSAYSFNAKVIQGGSFSWNDTTQSYLAIPTDPPIYYQFGLLNRRGAIAMARTSDMNSATSGWFINVTDNSVAYRFVNLSNAGYTAFGSVVGDGMTVVDAINQLPTEDLHALNPAFTTIPLISHTSGDPLLKQNLALITSVTKIAEKPGLFVPVKGADGTYTFTGIDTPVTAQNYLEAPGNPSPSDAPAGLEFSFGFYSFNLLVDTAGGAAETTLTLPDGQHPNTFYKYGKTPDNQTPHWYEFMWDGQTGATINAAGNVVTLHFVDGERGDDNLVPDKSIESVGAPVVAPSLTAVGKSGNGSTVRTGDPAVKLDAFSANALSQTAPGVDFTEGFFNLNLSNVSIGQESVVLTLPQGSAPNAFYLYGPTPDNPTPHLYDFSWNGQTGAIFGAQGNVVTLVFVDGQRGDDDLTVNGLIGNVGAPGNASSIGASSYVVGESGKYTTLRVEDPAATLDEFRAGTFVTQPSGVTFGEGGFGIKLSGVSTGSESVLLTLPQGAHPNYFYMYGSTPDNHTPHWYSFMWDGQTGAVITSQSNVIRLIFVDGLRGDNDLTQDGKIETGILAPGDTLLVGPSASTVGNSGTYSTITLESSADSVTAFGLAANPSPGDAPAGVTFGEGFFDIGLTTTQETVSVVLTLPKDQQPNTYYKYGPTPDNLTPHWYEFMWDGKTGAVMGAGANKNLVSLVFVDGERGDDDLAHAGIITDVGAPGVVTVSSGGGGGGAVDVWSLLALLGLSGWLSAQRRWH